MTREDELIKKWEQGDAGALGELVELFYPEILRYCFWHAPNRSLAEDATQETFLKAIRYFGGHVHQGKLKAFLYQIAANTCIDMRRKRWLTDTSIDETTAQTTYTEAEYETVQSDAVFRQMVNVLPEEQREIVILRFAQDLTIREISTIVNLPLRTVQSRLRTALKTLKKSLRKEARYDAARSETAIEKGFPGC